MCSSTLSDTANRLRKTRKEKSSAVPLFEAVTCSAICARLGSKGKVGVQRGRKTAGCPSFLPPRRAPRRSRRPQTANPPAEVQRKTLRPPRAEHRCAVRVAGAEAAARKGRTCLRSSCPPSGRCRKYIQKRAAAPMQQLFSMQNLNRTESIRTSPRRYARSPR